jgi:hypothetical protein
MKNKGNVKAGFLLLNPQKERIARKSIVFNLFCENIL